MFYSDTYGQGASLFVMKSISRFCWNIRSKSSTSAGSLEFRINCDTRKKLPRIEQNRIAHGVPLYMYIC